MKKVLFSLVCTFMLSACSHIVNKDLLINEAQKNTSFIKSKFISFDACSFALSVGESNTAKFMMASCALTEDQLIVYSSTASGELIGKLIYLDYDEVKGVALARYGKGGQIQLQIDHGKVILKPGGGTFDDLKAQEKYLNIFKEHGIKEFTPTQYIFPQKSGILIIPIAL